MSDVRLRLRLLTKAELVARLEMMRSEEEFLVAENDRLKAVLDQCAAPIYLGSSVEKEINYEPVMREVYRRMKLAKDALQ